MSAHDSYLDFLKAKNCVAQDRGFTIDDSDIHPVLSGHQRAGVRWGIRGGRRALFESFGMGKTLQQLEILRLILAKAENLQHGRGLIILPLNVRHEFMIDARKIDLCPRFVRHTEEVTGEGIYLTNYESVREGRLNPHLFDVCSLDEASCLRGFGGTKVFREFMKLLAGDDRSGARLTEVPYRFVATATPSPNEYIELLCYAAFLGIMDVSQAKTRFFKRDSTKADKLTLHPHKEEEFWLWVASWALFIEKPSDLGYSDEGYDLPPMTVHYHEVAVDHTQTGAQERDGQRRLFREATHGVVDASREKRDTLIERVAKAKEIVCGCSYCGGTGEVACSSTSFMPCPDCSGRQVWDGDDHVILWHDLEDERKAIEACIPGVKAVYGTQDQDEREKVVIDFSDGKVARLAGKPSMLGSGCNFQRHCHKAVYVGIGFKFNDFIQSLHRLHRFQQTHGVEVHVIYAESERTVLRKLLEKWERHKELAHKMSEIIKKYGLSQAAMTNALTRALGVERVEVSGANYRCINNDCILEMAEMETNSVGLVVTSIPFSTQYEYSPNYADLGHTDSNEHFFAQMDFLTPNLLRVLQSGRIAAIHVKDRIVPGGLNGMGFQTVYPFHCKVIEHYTKHGFAYMGMITVVTDVVRENNQTYRLGWSEQCKDATKMGVGMPEYVLIFRKPPSSTEKSYADKPVVKAKKIHHREHTPDCTAGLVEDAECICGGKGSWENPEGYSRARWQVDAHAFHRSSGDRVLTPSDLRGATHPQIFRMFRDYNMDRVYAFEQHVQIGEALEERGILPSDFMLLQPPSWHKDVWTDVTRMLTLNGVQNAKGKEMHICPMQFDIAETTPEAEAPKRRGRGRKAASVPGVQAVAVRRMQGG